MTFRYTPTPEEEAAAALLEQRGWVVSVPRCPDCHGWGFVYGYSLKGFDAESADVSTVPCPQRCPMAAGFFPTATRSSGDDVMSYFPS